MAFLTLAHPVSLLAAPAHSTVILLVDASGSMRKSDPEHIRGEAVELLLSMLQDGDRVSLSEFGDGVRDLGEGMVPLSGESKTRLGFLARGTGAAGAYTDILGALQHAEFQLRNLDEQTRQAFPPSVVLLTDGRDDVPHPPASRIDELERTLASLVEVGARVNCLGLSPEADRQMLNRIAQATGGETVYATQAQDLLEGFFDLSRSIGGRWLLEERPVTPGRLELAVPVWSTGMVLAFFSRGGSPNGLISVDGKGVPIRGDRYQILPFKPEGRTRVTLDIPSPGGFLIVDTQADLLLQLTVPERVAVGMPFPCRARVVSGGGGEVAAAAFLDRSSVSWTWEDVSSGQEHGFLYDDGTHNDGASRDGCFGGSVLATVPGSAKYKVCLKAPFSPELSTNGVTEILAAPLQVLLPSSGLLLLAALGGQPLPARIRNLTSVNLHVEASGPAAVATSLDIPAGKEGAISVRAAGTWMETRSEGLLLQVRGMTRPAWSGAVAAPPLATVPAGALLLLIMVGATMLFPRRTLEKYQLHMSLKLEGQAIALTRIVGFDEEGRPRLTEVPSPFDAPGRFVPRSGLWSKGVCFIPESPSLPEFFGSGVRSAKGKWHLRADAKWTCRAPGGAATYTLRSLD